MEYIVNLNEGSDDTSEPKFSEFRLSYYPHLLDEFTKLLDESFQCQAKHKIYGDFKPLNEIENPGFYIHVLQKSL